MNYEQKYNDALDAARHIYDDMKSGGNFGSMEDLEVIFPELAESEDERIRKALIRHFNEKRNCVGEVWGGLKCDDVIAYLEKQKEQKHPNGCFTCNEYKKGYEAGRSNGFTTGYNKAMKEQKPAEWSEGDEKMLNDCIMALSNWRDAVANYGHEVAPCQKLIDWLKSLRHSWKPSEEQMAALERTTRLANFGLEENRRKALVSLYEQLKAL